MFGDDPRTSIESVISEADTAMYAAKDGGRDGVRVFDPHAVRDEASGLAPNRRELAAQVEHPLRRRLELARSRPPARSFATSARQARSAGAEVGEEEQVGAGPGRRHPAFAGPPKARTATVSSASVIETPSKPRRLRSSPVAIARAKAAGVGREGGVDRGAEHHQLAPGATKRAVGRLVDRAQGRAWRGRSAAPRSRCSPPPRRCPGSAWRWPRRRRCCRPSANGIAVAATRSAVAPKPRSVAAIVPPGRATSRTGARSTLTPSSRRFAAVRRPCSRLKAAPRAPICRRRGRRGAADPLHQPALLVDHDQQRVAQRRRARDRLQARDQARGRRRGWGSCRRRGPRRPPGPRRSPSRARGETAVPPRPATIRSPASCGDRQRARRRSARAAAAQSPSAAPKAKAPAARPARGASASRRRRACRSLHHEPDASAVRGGS